MSDSTQSNPYAAPQIGPGNLESVVMDDAHLLTLAEVECSRMRVWVWIVGIMFVGFSLLTMLILLIVLLDRIPLLGVILNIVMLCLHGCAGVLMLRCASKITEFRSLPRPFQLEEFLVSHAACCKYLGIVGAVLLGLVLLLVLLELLLI